MANSIDTVRAHGERQQAAERLIRANGWNVSRRDKEAIVKYLLLEDILRIFQSRLDLFQARRNAIESDEKGKQALERVIAKYEALIALYSSVVDVAGTAIVDGNYRAVNRAVNERALLAGYDTPEQMVKMKNLASALLFELSRKQTAVLRSANVAQAAKRQTGETDFDAVIAAADSAFADE